MKRTEIPLPLRLQTPDGEIKFTGDNIQTSISAIDYRTGKGVPVSGLSILPPSSIYNLTFSDGRRGLYRVDDSIYLGDKIISIRELIRLVAELNPGPSREFYQHLGDGETVVILTENPAFTLSMNGLVDYNDGRQCGQPDPYSAGCILPIGDLFLDHVNLPADRTDGVESVMINNGWEMTTGDTVDIVCFKQRGDMNEKLITWSDFIRNGNQDDMMSPSSSELIRSNYLTTSVSDRLEYLRGFFDTNYIDLNLEGGLRPVERDIEVSLPYYGRIKFIRDIMFSLGIGSQLTSLNAGKDQSKYGLQPKCSLREFSALFNCVEKAERLLAAATSDRHPRQDQITLRSIELVWQEAETFNIVSDTKEPIIYMASNFLPRISARA